MAIVKGRPLCLCLFRVAPPLELKKLEALFRHNVFKMLLAKGKITREMIAMLSSWKHSGFHVFCGNRISPSDDTAMENLARYIIRASFSQERMKYLDCLLYTSDAADDLPCLDLGGRRIIKQTKAQRHRNDAGAARDGSAGAHRPERHP